MEIDKRNLINEIRKTKFEKLNLKHEIRKTKIRQTQFKKRNVKKRNSGNQNLKTLNSQSDIHDILIRLTEDALAKYILF